LTGKNDEAIPPRNPGNPGSFNGRFSEAAALFQSPEPFQAKVPKTANGLFTGKTLPYVGGNTRGPKREYTGRHGQGNSRALRVEHQQHTFED